MQVIWTSKNAQHNHEFSTHLKYNYNSNRRFELIPSISYVNVGTEIEKSRRPLDSLFTAVIFKSRGLNFHATKESKKYIAFTTF